MRLIYLLILASTISLGQPRLDMVGPAPQVKACPLPATTGVAAALILSLPTGVQCITLPNTLFVISNGQLFINWPPITLPKLVKFQSPLFRQTDGTWNCSNPAGTTNSCTLPTSSTPEMELLIVRNGAILEQDQFHVTFDAPTQLTSPFTIHPVVNNSPIDWPATDKVTVRWALMQ